MFFGILWAWDVGIKWGRWEEEKKWKKEHNIGDKNGSI
jgi:hypothetical protein